MIMKRSKRGKRKKKKECCKLNSEKVGWKENEFREKLSEGNKNDEMKIERRNENGKGYNDQRNR